MGLVLWAVVWGVRVWVVLGHGQPDSEGETVQQLYLHLESSDYRAQIHTLLEHPLSIIKGSIFIVWSLVFKCQLENTQEYLSSFIVFEEAFRS